MRRDIYLYPYTIACLSLTLTNGAVIGTQLILGDLSIIHMVIYLSVFSVVLSLSMIICVLFNRFYNIPTTMISLHPKVRDSEIISL